MMTTLFDTIFWSEVARTWLMPLGALALAVLLALAVHGSLLRLFGRLSRRTTRRLDDDFFAKIRGPSRLMLVLALAGVSLGLYPPPAPLDAWLGQLTRLLWLLAGAWLLIALSLFLEKLLLARVQDGDNLRARKALTQFTVLQRIFAVLVSLLALAGMLMSFEQVRQLGMSLLASAGLAGVVLGFSAQRTIASIIAGVQIAFTQPIRLDDVVIVEGEWGWVEEITFTYVVVRIWDQRRLVVPISHFLEKPFQNWTRVNSEILGTVYLYTDYGVPVNEVRAELSRICLNEGSALWDGRVCGLQVTDSGPQGVELRCLVSASNSSRAWDLRCLLRERLIAWLAANHPESLPLQRWREQPGAAGSRELPGVRGEGSSS